MKYIRTKDRIREIIEDFGGSCNVKSTYPKGRPSIDNFTVVRGVWFAPRADTIEELCDEFVIKFNDEENHIEVHKQIKKDDLGWAFNDIHNIPRRHISPLYLNNPFEIYGAIWTNKGLIYVAKMNEEGVLCLI